MKTEVRIFNKTESRKMEERDFKNWIWEVLYILKELLISLIYALLGFLVLLYLASFYFRAIFGS